MNNNQNLRLCKKITEMCMFDEFQTKVDCQDQDARRWPVCDALHDAFLNIRDNELEY